jgi:hypothetical protein
MLALRIPVLALVALVLISGCAQMESADQEPSSSPSELQETQTQAPEPAPSTTAPTEDAFAPETCTQEVQLEIERTISAQTQAFAENEFEAAYQLASPRFRASVTLNAFVAIISGSYGPLISSSSLDFNDCLMSAGADVGIIDVSFVQGGQDVYALRYLIVETTDGWRVEGASNLEVVGKGA